MHAGVLATGGDGYGVVNVHGEAVSSAVSAGIRVNADGTIDSRKGAGPTYAQVDAATDWIFPPSKASKRTYHVKMNVNPSSMLGDTMQAWIEIDGDKEWWHVSSGLNRNYQIEISADGGTTTLSTGAAQDISVP